MSTYSIYNLLVDNTLAFTPGITAGYILSMNSDGTTSWIENTGGNGGASESVDGSFLQSLDIQGTVRSIDIQSDKKILIGGDFTSVNGDPAFGLVRLNTDLSIDSSFLNNLGSGFMNTVNIIKVQPDGKILIGGGFEVFNGLDRGRIVRLNSDGTEDLDFYDNIGVGFNNTVNTIELDTNSKILIGGDFTSFSELSRHYIVRLKQNGKEDKSYSYNIGTFNNGVNVIRKQRDGNTLIGGKFTTYNTTLGLTGATGGPGTVTRRHLVRVNYYGQEESTFYLNLNNSFNNNVSDIQIDSDNNIFVVGDFQMFNQLNRNYIVKLNSNGVEDSTFYSNLGSGFNSSIKSIKVQPNGKILISGSFTSFNGASCSTLSRVGIDGEFDEKFQEALPNINNTTNIINTIDGYIYIGGSFTNGFMSLYNYSQLAYKKPLNQLIYNLPVPSIKLSTGTVSLTTWNASNGLDDDAVLHRYPICITTDLTQELIDNYEVRIEMLLYKRNKRGRKKKYSGYIIADRNYNNTTVGPQFLDTGEFSFSRTEFSKEWTRGGGTFHLNRFNQYRVKALNEKIPVWEYLHSRFKYYNIKYRSTISDEDLKACIFIQSTAGKNRPTGRYSYSPYYCPLYISFRYVIWIPEADYGRGQYVSGPMSKVIKITASFFPFRRNIQAELDTGLPTSDLNSKFIYNHLSCWFQDG